MRAITALIFLAVATVSLAETYKWEDDQGVHFTENANSIPQKYRAKALADARGDITTTDPSIRQQVERANREAKARAAQERVEESRQSALKEKRELAEKLAKTNCTGTIPGECGPGRACVYNPFTFSRKTKTYD